MGSYLLKKQDIRRCCWLLLGFCTSIAIIIILLFLLYAKVPIQKPIVQPRVLMTGTQAKVDSKRIDATEQEELEKAYYRRRPEKVSPFNHKVILDENSLCLPDTFLVILVPSAPKNTENRQVIRETWGKAAKSAYWPHKAITDKISLGFVLGIPPQNYREVLKNESLLYRDIIQGDFIDKYKNLTLKSLLALQWVDRFCSQAKYFLKSDDDMVINLPYLLEILHSKSPQRSIMGLLCQRAKVNRRGKWEVTKELFPFDMFPPYESGTAYIITVDVVHELYETAEYVPRFQVEDAYITGVLGKIIEVQHVTVAGFASESITACNIVENKVVTGHKIQPLALYRIWKELEDGPVCKVSMVNDPTHELLNFSFDEKTF